MSLRFGRERNIQNHIHSIRKPLKELDGWISGSKDSKQQSHGLDL
jgi:hypothetical protein